MMKKIFTTTIISILLTSVVNAKEELKNTKTAISLQECIETALKNNLDIKLEQYNIDFSLFSLKKTEDEFPFLFGLQPSIRQGIRPTANSFVNGTSLLNETSNNYSLYAKKKLLSGGDLSLNFDNSIFFTNSTRTDFNPSITPRLSLGLSQPLLKNAFNGQKRIEISKNDNVNSGYRLKAKTIEIISSVQNTYWDLVLTEERLNVLKNSLELTKDLLKINKEKEKAGFIAKIDVLSTEANLASKEENILQVEKELGNNQDRLKRILNKTSRDEWKSELYTKDKPSFKLVETNFDEMYEKSLKSRPDFQIALMELKSVELQKSISEQNKLPQLNMNAEAGLESLDTNYFTAVTKLFNFKTYFWNLGLSFELPVAGNLAETQYKENLLRETQQKTAIENLKQRVFMEIKQAIRNVEINKKRVEANKFSKKLAEEQVKAETEKLNLGLSTNFQVLQYQRAYEEAALSEVNALIDYIKSVNYLGEVEGTLLEKNNLVLDIKNEL